MLDLAKTTFSTIASLREMDILKETGKRSNLYVELATPINEFIQDIVDKMHYEDMFFTSNKQFEDVKNNIRCKPRDQSIIQEVLQESGYTCFFSEQHETFPSYSRPNYVEGHHVIPVALNDSFDEELDCKENVIALCPNCHKAMHYATNEFKENLLQTILNNNANLNKFDVNLEDMKEIYFTKKIPLQL